MSFPLLRWLLLLACWAAAAPALALLAALLVADNLQVARHFEWPHATIGMLAFVLAAVAAMSRRLARALTAEELRGLEQRHRANLLVRHQGRHPGPGRRRRRRQPFRALQAVLGHAPDADTRGWPGFFEQVHPRTARPCAPPSWPGCATAACAAASANNRRLPIA